MERDAESASRWIDGARRLLAGSALAAVVLGCSPPTSIEPADFATAIVGTWQGVMGDVKESISFRADGTFHARLREQGFISNTLSQGVTGEIRGNWSIDGNVITMRITDVDDARAAEGATSSTIVAMSQDELSLRGESGETARFLRAEPL